MSLLGNLTVGILGNMSGLSSTLGKAKTEVQKFGDSAQKLGKSISGVGETLTKKLTLPAVAAASALATITLVKGFDRLIGIDTAQAKLKGLGHDAESVTNIMTSALDSVKGTAYGLDEAATTAASAVAAGIKPGQDLTRYLSLTGDAAAIAGSSMGEMGSIFNKVQTAQKAYSGELNQLADRGIPIFQWLAEEAGITAEEVRDMASSGEVSSELFLKAIENNIGGAAKTIGQESFTAAIANIWASVGRIGANFLDAGGEAGGFFSTVKPLLSDFNGMLGGVEEKAAQLGVKFGEVFNAFLDKVKEIKATFDGLSPAMQEMILKVTAIGTAIVVGIGPALTIIGTLISSFGGLTSGIGFLSAAIGLISAPVALAIAAAVALGVALVALWKNSETFRDTVTGAFEKIKDVAQKVFETVAKFIGEKIAQIKQFWDQNGGQFLAAVENVFNGIKAVIEFVMPAVLFIVEMAWTAIKQVIDGALNIIMGLIKVFSGLFTGDFGKMWEGVKQIFFGAIDLIIGWMTLTFLGGIKAILTNLLKTGVGLVKNLADDIVKFFKSFTTTGQNLAKGMVDGVVNFFKNLLSNAQSIFGTLRTFGASVWNSISQTILGIARNIWNGVTTNFNNMLSSIKNIFGTVRSTIESIWNNVMSFFKSINLYSIGADIIRGLINGIGSMASAVWDKAKSIATGIGDSIKNALQIKSPSRLMFGIGKFVGMGLEDGMDAMIPSISKAAKQMANAALPNIPQLNPTMAKVNSSGSNGSGGNGLFGGITQQLTINSPTPLSPSEIAKQTLQSSRKLAMEWGL